jgi:hypothetical protein
MPSPPAKRKSGPLANIPQIDPALYQNIGKYHGVAVLTAFEQIGGVQRLTEWADENTGEFYTKIWAKTISTPKELQVSGTVSIEQAIKALDAEELTPYPDAEDATYEDGDSTDG